MQPAHPTPANTPASESSPTTANTPASESSPTTALSADAFLDVDLRPHLGVSIHMQGIFLLILLLLAFWSMLAWSKGVIADALHGDDGAVVAKASTAKTEGSGTSDEPLDNAEVAALQAALAKAGYESGPTDGIMGDLTRSAMELAREELGLTGSSDRTLLEELIGSTSTQNENTGPG